MTSALRSLPRHPRTGLRALGMSNRGPIWPVVGASEPATGPAPAPAGPPPTPAPQPAPPPAPPADPAPPSGDEPEYPPSTPLAEMTVEQREAYWRAQARKHEGRVKAMGDYDQLREKAGQYDQFARASMTEQEKAVDAARTEARAEAQREFGSRLVDAQITAASAGRLTDAQRAALLDGLNRDRYLTSDGEVDTDKVAALIDGLAAPAATGPAAAPRRPDLGQGRRDGAVKASMQSGADRYREKHPATTTT